MAKDLYGLLDLKKDASDADIRKAYRRLAKQYHPDLNPDDKAAEERFKEISGAFSILGDADKRAAYDRGEIDERGEPRYAGAGPGAGMGAGPGGGPYWRDFAEGPDGRKYTYTWTEGGPEGFAAGGFDDILNQFFGSGRAGQHGGGAGGGPRGAAGAGGFAFPGADARYALAVDFLDAVNGATKQIQLPDGSALNVKIPAGLRDGQTLRLKGKGQPGHGGAPAGDALVEVSVRPHSRFRRKGADIETDLAVSLPEAVLGAKVPVPTVTGEVQLTVPRGASSGTVLRLKGKGVPAGSGRPAGDQLVRLQVVLPKEVDPELEAFMTEWAEKHPYDPRSGKGGS
ncbi:DnaJ C-terminal domain-containing protein [Marinibaculum pumilum]|uniref:DnaJ C-terminal domain-containing protein n=1 Tax=Marinibaculum pumilum TaxID=1766165 RepID=A0ABV7L1T2_9PROT